MLRPVWESFRLLRRHQKIIFLSIVGARVLVHILDLLGLAAVGLLGAMLASGLTDRSEAEFFGLRVPVESSGDYLWVTVAIAGFFLAKSALGTLLLRVTTLFLARVEARSASEVARYFFSGDLSRVRSMSRGDIQWAVSTSSQVAFSTMLFAGSALVTESALFASVFVAFIFVDLSTALVITAYFVVLIIAFQLSINQRLRRLGQRMATISVTLNNSVLDMANAFRELTVLEKRAVFLQRFDKARLRWAEDQSLQRFVMGLPRFFVEAALMVGIMALIIWQFARGTLSEGLVVTGIFLAGGTRMMAAMLPLQNAVTSIRIDGPRAARARELILKARQEKHGEDFQAESLDAIAFAAAGVPVDFGDVSYRYPDSTDFAVTEVSLKIKGGSFAALVGPSGAGKTTIADLILGIQEPTSGTVSVAGYAPQLYRKAQPGSLAYVPQRPGMVAGTIAENIALGIPAAEIDRERVHSVLSKAGLWDAVAGLEQGMDTSLGENADSLSGGQIQRLGIARALYSQPKLLVLDEATSALDAETEAGIAETIESLRGEVTLVVIAHRLSTIQHADEVFVIEEGGLTDSGSFGEVRKRVPLIEKYVQLMKINDH